MKLILEFQLPEERSEANLAQSAGKLHCIISDVSQYARQLRKYEDREAIPVNELVLKLNELLANYYAMEIE